MSDLLVMPSDEMRTPSEMRNLILDLERTMFQMKDRIIDIKTTHHFAPGVYMREVFIPQGATVTGKIHKTEHLNILSQGRLAVWTEDGLKKLEALTVIKSKPGIKRVAYAYEDSVWITVHPTDETDLEKLEEMLIAKSFDEVLEFLEKPLIEGDKL